MDEASRALARYGEFVAEAARKQGVYQNLRFRMEQLAERIAVLKAGDGPTARLAEDRSDPLGDIGNLLTNGLTVRPRLRPAGASPAGAKRLRELQDQYRELDRQLRVALDDWQTAESFAGRLAAELRSRGVSV